MAQPLQNLTKKMFLLPGKKNVKKLSTSSKKFMFSSCDCLSRSFILTTDVSGPAIGYILSQLDSEGKERVCAYNGRSPTEAERKWCISEKECLAVLKGIKTYHVYLDNNSFEIYTDHQALKWPSTIKQSTG